MHESFFKDSKKHAAKIIYNEKKKMVPLITEEAQSYDKQKAYHICKIGFSTDDDNKDYQKVRDHCHYTGKYRGAAHNICSLRHKTPKEFTAVFLNGSTYDYHFIIKKLA